MPWHAVDCVDDALDATRSFLLPFEFDRWARLALVVLFLRGGSTTANYVTNVPKVPGPAAPGGVPAGVPRLPAGSGDLATALTVVAAVVALLLLVVVAVMRFVFLDAFRTGEVRVREPFRRRFREGVRYLVFNVGAGLLLVVALVTALFALTSGGLAVFESVRFAPLKLGFGIGGSVIIGLSTLAAVVVAVSFFHFTRAFVAPTMVATGSGVVDAWKRFWLVLRANPREFVVYLFARFVLSVVAGVVASFVVVVAGGVVAAVAAGVGLVVAAPFGGVGAALHSTLGLVLLGGIALVAVLALLVLVALPARVVVQSFLVAYELTVLGRVDPALDLLSDDDGPHGVTQDGTEAGGTGGDEDTADEATADEPPSDGATDDENAGFEFGVPEVQRTDTREADSAEGEGSGPPGDEGSGPPGVEEDDSPEPGSGTVDSGDSGAERDDDGTENGDDSRPYWTG